MYKLTTYHLVRDNTELPAAEQLLGTSEHDKFSLAVGCAEEFFFERGQEWHELEQEVGIGSLTASGLYYRITIEPVPVENSPPSPALTKGLSLNQLKRLHHHILTRPAEVLEKLGDLIDALDPTYFSSEGRRMRPVPQGAS